MSKGESLQDFLERQKNFWDYNVTVKSPGV